MCGIVGGMSSTLNQGELTKIKGLMVMSCFRGMYGSGSMVVVPSKKKTLQILTHKTELCAAELMCEEEFLQHISGSPKIVITHARAPTKGDNSLPNVHPHRSKHITGVHNGTMHRIMDKPVGADDSDSAAVFAAIADHGVEAFVKESRGAYSLVWIDAKDGTLNFLRNDQRPMVMASVGYQDNCRTMFFASELGMLHYVLKREGMKVEDVLFETPKAWQHVRYPLDVKHKIEPLELKQYEDPVKASYSGPYSGGHWAGWEDDLDGYMDSGNVTPIQRRIQDNARRNLPAIIDHRRGAPLPRPVTMKVEEILARRAAPRATFRGTTDDKHRNLIKYGPCCLCDNTPSVVSKNGTTLYPIVHEVRLGSGYPQYICDECVQARNPIAVSVLDLPELNTQTKH